MWVTLVTGVNIRSSIISNSAQLGLMSDMVLSAMCADKIYLTNEYLIAVKQAVTVKLTSFVLTIGRNDLFELWPFVLYRLIFP